MTSRRDTNQEHGDTENIPHFPESVYRPDPFPFNPSEGNPWARSNSHLPYVPPYSNEIDSYNADPHKNQDHSNQREVSKDIDPENGFSTGDSGEPPNAQKSKVSTPVIQALHNGRPNGKRLLLRFLQFLFSAAAFGFIVGAPAYSGGVAPDFNQQAPIILLYIISILSAVTSFSFLVNYCTRRYRHGEKVKRWIMLLVDLIFAGVWGIEVFVLIGKYRCQPGGSNHWCDFYNTSIFFSVCAFATYAVAFVWDIVGACSSKARMNYNA